jgi:thiol-disulfide isomerase/thioredoxin
MTAGVVALIVALACAIAGGAVWRQRNGRMRSVGVGLSSDSGSGGQGDPEPTAADLAGRLLTSADLGESLGQRATLIQFSSAFCAPCRSTRRILAEVAGMTAGVAYVEIDAESRLDLVRSLNVLRTPTVLVTDADGRIVKRASGQPRKADVIAALGQAVAETFSENSVGKDESDIRVRPA